MRFKIAVLKRHITLKRLGVFFGGLILGAFFVIAGTALYTQGNPLPDKREREAANTAQNIVNDVTELNPVHVVGIVVPHTIEEIVDVVKSHEHISIGGGRNSMGGQTASEKAVQIDMREYNKILNLSTTSKEITVQAGIRWRDIQDYIDPHNLSVKIMQTYSNFTVGGSLSVNVHGRYIGLGPIILSVKSFRIVLADGSVIEASPSEHADIFYSAIGGMGGIGVIADVTLELADNVNVERTQTLLKTTEYWQFFKDEVRDNPKTLFHNGDMYPPAFENISAVSWNVTDAEPTTEDRLIPREQDYWLERFAWVVMSEWPWGRSIREHLIDPYLYREHPVHTRNYEASYDVAELEPEGREKSTYVLQEYFVPVERFDEWVPKMKKVFNDNDVNVINVSIRHALPDLGAKLAWARTESFAFVVYYKQGTDAEAVEAVGKWTRQMIDAVLTVGGTYYLPYQLHATDEQLHRAYPHTLEYFEIKKQYDPTNKFTNKLWDKYYSEEKYNTFKSEREITALANTVPEYFRAFDNAYLALPEWYIVYSADEYANVLRDGLPSDFAYFGAHKDYWAQHEAVITHTESSVNNNESYLTVLSVIGWSFSTENIVKGVYENTIGRISEWIAGDKQVPEDVYAAHIAKQYADFIYDYPWYDFDYGGALAGVWILRSEGHEPLLSWVRRIERKLFLSLEYALKAAYSSVIAYATQTKFGVQDDVVYAIISRDGGITREIIQAPHYHPFTRMLLDELETESANSGFQILDIAGNKKISLTYRDTVGSGVLENTTEILRDIETQGIVEEQLQTKDRITVEVSVNDIPMVYRALKSKSLTIDHFYDY